MGMPQIPDLKPNIKIDREDVISLLLISIALEELSLAHIMSAEGEKIQCFTSDKHGKKCDFDELIKINKTVNETLKNVIKKEMLLQFKFENVLDLIDDKKKAKKCEE